MSTIFTNLKLDRKKSEKTEQEQPLKETYSDFEEWFDNFFGNEGGYSPPSIRGWFDDVQKAHVSLREQIGGIRTHTTYGLPEYKGPAELGDCHDLIARLKGIIPYYLEDSNFNQSVLLSGSIPNGMRTGKHIMKYANTRRISEEKRQELSKIISELGEKWASAKTSEQEIIVTISTSAKAFASIGHYGPDDVSCFKQSGSNASNKYSLGRYEGTFVVLLRSSMGRVHEPTGSKSTLARLWGFLNDEENVVNFCNYYPAKGFMEGNAFEACKNEAAQILGCSVEDITCEKNRINIPSSTNIYHNNKESQPNWSFFIGEKAINTQTL